MGGCTGRGGRGGTNIHRDGLTTWLAGSSVAIVSMRYVVYKGMRYATLDNADPLDTATNGCQSQSLPVPDGWAVVTDNPDVRVAMLGPSFSVRVCPLLRLCDLQLPVMVSTFEGDVTHACVMVDVVVRDLVSDLCRRQRHQQPHRCFVHQLCSGEDWQHLFGGLMPRSHPDHPGRGS